jgi:hypothetical protein
MSAEQFLAMQACNDKVNHTARKKQFETEFGDWIAAQNAQVETSGIPGADLRPW